MTTKQGILDYLDNVLHPIVSPDNWNVYSELYDMIEELPSAEPVRHGKWVGYPYCLCYEGALTEDDIACSSCGAVFNVIDNCTETFKYCPNCGCRMDAK